MCGDGSSSTTTATFFISSRKRGGISSSAASDELAEIAARVIATPAPSYARRLRGPERAAVVVAVVADDALLAERLRLADAAAVQDQRVGRPRPLRRRHRSAELLLDDLGIVRPRDADPVRDAQHVPIDRQSGDAERVAEHDVRRLAADARQLDERVHRRRHLAAVSLDERRSPCR